jgi:hypothetical protein
MVMLGKYDLGALRAANKASREEVREDLARRELEDPPFDPRPVTRAAPLGVVYKITNSNGGAFDDEPVPLLDADEIASGVAAALAQACDQMRSEVADAIDPLEQRLTTLEAQMATLLSVLGGGDGNGGTRATRSRKRTT